MTARVTLPEVRGAPPRTRPAGLSWWWRRCFPMLGTLVLLLGVNPAHSNGGGKAAPDQTPSALPPAAVEPKSTSAPTPVQNDVPDSVPADVVKAPAAGSARTPPAGGLPKVCTLTEASDGPEMVVIEGGRYTMGSPADEAGRDSDEGPQHEVVVQPFALGRCEVTVGEFRRFIDDRAAQGQPYRTTAETNGGCVVWNAERNTAAPRADANWRAPGFTQTDAHPVVCVSITDAQAYAAWLTQRTGRTYRLPSESEWEYAARAGTTGPYWWGYAVRRDGQAMANCDGCGSAWDNQRTAPVGQFEMSAYGLFDMHGNALEWVADCWHPTYERAPHDGAPWLLGNAATCDAHITRGGSWLYVPDWLRSANRVRVAAIYVSYSIGFRMARTLP